MIRLLIQWFTLALGWYVCISFSKHIVKPIRQEFVDHLNTTVEYTDSIRTEFFEARDAMEEQECFIDTPRDMTKRFSDLRPWVNQHIMEFEEGCFIGTFPLDDGPPYLILIGSVSNRTTHMSPPNYVCMTQHEIFSLVNTHFNQHVPCWFETKQVKENPENSVATLVEPFTYKDYYRLRYELNKIEENLRGGRAVLYYLLMIAEILTTAALVGSSLNLCNKSIASFRSREDKITSNPQAQCSICMSNVKNVLFSPCNHLCVCVECSQRHTNPYCPVCRTAIRQRTRVYL